MAYTFYASHCEACWATVQLMPPQVTVVAQLDTLTHTYRFECPSCGAVTERPASDRLVGHLLRTGADFKSCSSPALTEADVVQFVAELEAWDG